jgi:Lrp/AsnC family leucine-responsive transcriptional regulator
MPGNGRTTAGSAFGEHLLDATNRSILQELQANARISVAELARRVHLSAPSAAERVQRLEQAGVITGYLANVNPRAIGFPIQAIVRVRPAVQQVHRIADIARDVPEVVECHRITGEDCYYMTLHLRSMDELEPIIDRFVPFGQTTTSIVQSSPVARRPLPL